MASDLWKGRVLQWVASDCNMKQIIQLWDRLFLEDSSEEDGPGTGFHRELRKGGSSWNILRILHMFLLWGPWMKHDFFSWLFPVYIGSELSLEAPKWAPHAFSGQGTETETSF